MTIEATVTLSSDEVAGVGRDRIRLLQTVAREGSIIDAGPKRAGVATPVPRGPASRFSATCFSPSRRAPAGACPGGIVPRRDRAPRAGRSSRAELSAVARYQPRWCRGTGGRQIPTTVVPGYQARDRRVGPTLATPARAAPDVDDGRVTPQSLVDGDRPGAAPGRCRIQIAPGRCRVQ